MSSKSKRFVPGSVLNLIYNMGLVKHMEFIEES